MAIEVQLSGAISTEDVKNSLWRRNLIGTDLLDAVVVSRGPRVHRRSDAIAVVPAALREP